jgi:RNA polymerase sigma factor (sigma-70 family)
MFKKYYQIIPLSELDQDLSDTGEEMRRIESEADYYYLLKRLNPRQRQIIELLRAGYNQKETAKELKISEKTVQREMSVLRKKVSIINNGGVNN